MLKYGEHLITVTVLFTIMGFVAAVEMPVVKVVTGFGFAVAFFCAISTCTFKSHFITVSLVFGILAIAVELYEYGDRMGKSHFYYMVFQLCLAIGVIRRTFQYLKRKRRGR